jgi:RimJ/RimL family protein N-acetyltransferase
MLFSTDVLISGDGLTLREWVADDVPAMVELFDEASIDVWTPLASPFDTDAAQHYVDRARLGKDTGVQLQLAITRDMRTPLGEVLLFEGEPAGTAELAYAVGLKHRRQGLAVRAVRLMMTYARESCGVTNFVVKVSPANAASQNVARAAGFVLTDEPSEIRERKNRRIEVAVWRC